MPRRATDNVQALATFLSAKAEIDVMLARLQTLSAEHFNATPDEVTWGHVGMLEHYRGRLREIADSALREGEHAG